MNLDSLKELYRQLILDHAQHPHHYGKLKAADQQVQLNNPTCGDVIELAVTFDTNREHIQKIAFSGEGCSISQASASMMCDLVSGQTLTEVKQEIQIFLELLMANREVNADQLGDAAVLAAVVKFPARIKCATLAWKALEQAIMEVNADGRS